ncbi:F0F1 ATP synthase subunit A [Lacipirellula limnantheis]|uniref:ATP synthase subunit a n=1 Tax=Lacipirellula limnantheis TaxID=2528024 RepID=A0A517U062_9BACT|nr:F0F1 ATP synthase subunit A [Lacipirellula limnantheis]QDT74012.1 ATP synthase subunit a [Lacipirellula limnantheis]
MASPILHIKDAYYFEVPRSLWKSTRQSRNEFPDHYIRLDSEFQDWEAKQQYDDLAKLKSLEGLPAEAALMSQYHSWVHDHANFAKPFDRFLEEAPSQAWFQQQLALGRFAKQAKGESAEAWTARLDAARPLQQQWAKIKAQADNLEEFKATAPDWSPAKIAEYNHQLDGKILIPQPFGKLKNNYERESGFAISKFMILEVVVALILIVVFTALAAKVRNGRPAKGKLWNLFESFLLFIRDDIARPAIGHHDADRFVPLLWTIFMFVLGCNLLGMLPWVGAPTGSFSVTIGLALVTFATVIVAGSLRFGIVGFWKNQVPQMGLPLPLAIFIVPMLFAIEVLGLLIKHLVLSIRLLANMVAGHLVLLAIMGLAVAAAASANWHLTATISVIGSALFSLLELFVAFLQAYVFTFLSALFIGAAVHHH